MNISLYYRRVFVTPFMDSLLVKGSCIVFICLCCKIKYKLFNVMEASTIFIIQCLEKTNLKSFTIQLHSFDKNPKLVSHFFKVVSTVIAQSTLKVQTNIDMGYPNPRYSTFNLLEFLLCSAYL